MAHVRLSDAEWATWTGAARGAGYGRTAAWVRAVVAEATTTERAVSGAGDERGARELAGQIARIGSNLNQVARALNLAMAGGEKSVTAQQAHDVVATAQQELRALRAAVEGRAPR